MSSFRTYETEMTEQDTLCKVLTEQQLKFTVHPQPVKLKGWGSALAEIVIPKGAHGNLADIGFAKVDGRFRMIRADDDHLSAKLIEREYAVRKTKDLAGANGMRFVSREAVKTDRGFQTKLIFEPRSN